MAKESKRKADSRDLALSVLLTVDTTTKGSQEALSEAFAQYPAISREDRGLTTELIYGCLRWKQQLDCILAKGTTQGRLKLNRHLRWAFRIGAYQLVHLDRIPPHAAVDNCVRQVKMIGGKGIAGFANAVLRKVAVRWREFLPKEGTSTKSLSLRYSHPEWLIEEWIRRWSKESMAEICEAYSLRAPVVVRVRPNAIDEVREVLREENIDFQEGYSPTCLRLAGGIDPRNHRFFEEGKWISQDEGSQWVIDSIEIPTGSSVLDYCAGTGTKTTQIADAAGPNGRVVAMDIQRAKLDELEHLCNRWGQTIEIHQGDGRKESPLQGEQFDFVVIDAPCTGLGTIRRRPEIKWRRNRSDISRMHRDQVGLLLKGAEHVRPGGVLVYAVCSNIVAECEEVVAEFLAKTNGQFGRKNFTDDEGPGEALLSPLRDGMDGFFVAHLTRH